MKYARQLFKFNFVVISDMYAVNLDLYRPK